jgi:hypothetical protein
LCTCQDANTTKISQKHLPGTKSWRSRLIRSAFYPYRSSQRPKTSTSTLVPDPKSTRIEHPLYCCLDALPDFVRMRERKHYKCSTFDGVCLERKS